MKTMSRQNHHHDTLDETSDDVPYDTITFTCTVAPDARKVYLVGDFNNWDPTACPMTRKNGIFRKAIRLSPGEHQYKFVIDGEWHSDPAALGEVVNELGSLNSVLWV